MRTEPEPPYLGPCSCLLTLTCPCLPPVFHPPALGACHGPGGVTLRAEAINPVPEQAGLTDFPGQELHTQNICGSLAGTGEPCGRGGGEVLEGRAVESSVWLQCGRGKEEWRLETGGALQSGNVAHAEDRPGSHRAFSKCSAATTCYVGYVQCLTTVFPTLW